MNTRIPLVRLLGPYRSPHSGLIPVEIYHIDGSTHWTWDGRGTPYPSSALDRQLYGPQSLRVQESFIFDSEDLSPEELKRDGLEKKTSSMLLDHRPLVVEYVWH